LLDQVDVIPAGGPGSSARVTGAPAILTDIEALVNQTWAPREQSHEHPGCPV